jgi:hypothetical protein
MVSVAQCLVVSTALEDSEEDSEEEASEVDFMER